MKYNYRIKPEDVIAVSILNFLNHKFTGTDWQTEISRGAVRINNRIVNQNYKIKCRDTLEYSSQALEPEVDSSFDIIYEDEYLLVINKSGNLPVHPSGVFKKNTLIEHVKKKYGNFHLLQRLDRETSGIICLCKQKQYIKSFVKELKAGQKLYFTCVHSEVKKKRFQSSLKLGAKPNAIVRKRQGKNDQEGKYSKTDFYKIYEKSGFSLLFAIPHSGRMHQIRATLCELNYPVVGDKIYGKDERYYLDFIDKGLTKELKEKLLLERQFLHCWKLYFFHPVLKKKICFKATISEDLRSFIDSYLK